MEYDKTNNLLGNERENLSIFVTREYENLLIVYLICIMKINQLYLKRLSYDQIYVIIWMRIF